MGYFPSTPVLIGRILGLIIGFTLHEWAHAYAAYRIGGYRALPDTRRLSLDPRVHLDPVGVVLVLVSGFGWAKPVPVNPNAFYPNQRRDMMLVALAGPLMNLLISVVFGIIVRLMIAAGMDSGGVLNFILTVTATIVLLNIVLFVFNLIPLAPLDGWKVMLGLLPPDSAYEMMHYERESTMVLILLILFGVVGLDVLGTLLSPPITALARLIMG